MRTLVVSLLIPLLGGCSILDTKTQGGYSLSRSWNVGWDHEVGTAFTTADVRIITKRRHPVMNNVVLCTEPSPDVAAALAASAGAKASGGAGAANGSLGLSGSSAESVAELAGRSTALLGLRDGLFRACEAYANGVLGQDAYALVLAHYGELMTTLFLGQDITGAAGAEGKALATANIAAAAAAAATTAAKTGESSSDGSPSAVKTAAEGDQATPAAMITPISVFGMPVQSQVKLIAATNDKDAAKKGATPKGSAKPDKSNTSSKPTAAAQAAGVSATAALALARMNEDYMYEGIMQGIIVACINEADPTRLSVRLNSDGSLPDPLPSVDAADEGIKNPWLRDKCKGLNLKALLGLQIQAALVEKIDPTKLPASNTDSGKNGGDNNSHQADNASPVVAAVQLALQRVKNCSGCAPKRVDGMDGPDTRAAVKAYQGSVMKSTDPNGTATDPALLKSLGLDGLIAGNPAGAPDQDGRNGGTSRPT